MSIFKILGMAFIAFIGTALCVQLMLIVLYDSINISLTETSLVFSVVLGGASLIIVLIMGLINKFRQ